MRIFGTLASAMVVWLVSLADLAQAVSFSGTVLDYEVKQIYHSPETPGATRWVGLWQLPNGTVQTDFTQIVTQNGSLVSSYPSLRTSDSGHTWTSAPASVKNGNRGMEVVNQTLFVRPQWSSTLDGYTQYSTNGGSSWSAPTYFTNTATKSSWPTVIHRLGDGRLILFAGVVDDTTVPEPQRSMNVEKQFFISNDNGCIGGIRSR